MEEDIYKFADCEACTNMKLSKGKQVIKRGSCSECFAGEMFEEKGEDCLSFMQDDFGKY